MYTETLENIVIPHVITRDSLVSKMKIKFTLSNQSEVLFSGVAQCCLTISFQQDLGLPSHVSTESNCLNL